MKDSERNPDVWYNLSTTRPLSHVRETSRYEFRRKIDCFLLFAEGWRARICGAVSRIESRSLLARAKFSHTSRAVRQAKQTKNREKSPLQP